MGLNTPWRFKSSRPHLQRKDLRRFGASPFFVASWVSSQFFCSHFFDIAVVSVILFDVASRDPEQIRPSLANTNMRAIVSRLERSLDLRQSDG